MQVWGTKQGLKDQEIMNALEENMYHEGGSQRFSLETDQSGAVHISVHKRNQRWPQQGSNGDSWKHNDSGQSNSHWQDNNSRWDAGSAPPSARPVDTTNVATPNRAFNLWGSGRSDASDARGVWEQSSSNDSWKKDDPSQNKWWEQEEKSSWDSRPPGEQVQRWLGWVLKSGYRSEGIYLKDGEWGSLDVLAEVLSKSKPNLNVHNSADLRDVLEKTDLAGRFEINDQGDVRKVKRDSRVTRPQGDDGDDQSWHKSWGSNDNQSPNYAQDKNRLGDDSVWNLIGGSSKKEASPQRHQSNRQSTDEDRSSKVSPSKKPSAPQAEQRPPPPPPGENWKKYVDDGFFWYYYEGPLGKWWCQQKEGTTEVGEVEPWPDDADDED
jgi:hypothetical protein